MPPAAYKSQPRGRPVYSRPQQPLMSNTSPQGRQSSPLRDASRNPPFYGTPRSQQQSPSPLGYSSLNERQTSPLPPKNQSRREPSLIFNGIRNWSNPSFLSKATAGSGPSKEEPAAITSNWGIGWQTLTLMIVCYVLALAIALAHLMLFRYINGKEADGPNQVASQGFITTTSNILANAFGYAIRGSLAIAFVQHLWHLLRVYTMKVSTIEALFDIRSNLFILFKPAVVLAAPLLCALAMFIWATQIVTSFPPGAIQVTTVQRELYGMVTVPWFNASFMGNASGYDANYYSLMKLNLDPGNSANDGFVSGFVDPLNDDESGIQLHYIARQILVGGESLDPPSPCGANCSYIMEFEGPYMYCNTSSVTSEQHNAGTDWTIYHGQLSNPVQQPANPALWYRGNYTGTRFNTTTLTALEYYGETNNGTDTSNATATVNMIAALIQEDSMACVPGRARYIVNNTYTNFQLTRNITTEPIEWLTTLLLTTHDNIVVVPYFSAENESFAYGTIPATWSPEALIYYRDNNMMALVTSLTSWLHGGFIAHFKLTGLEPNLMNPEWAETVYTDEVSGVTVYNGTNAGTIVDSTRFNNAYGRYLATDDLYPSFNVTQNMLNDYLFNMTVSTMVSYGLWTTDVNATTLTTVNVYNFQQPLTFILLYFCTLLVALPFIVFGIIALFRNGVSAMDNSFTQIITTSTGSAALDRAAAGGCLGGNESIPKELKELKVRFGEFIGRDDPGRIKRAGFGVEGEVISLKKGEKYGIAKWI